MSDKLIPETIDPNRFAEQNLTLEGNVRLADMARLNSTLNAPEDVVAVRLTFGVDEQGTTFIKGHLDTTLVVECQRCMEPFRYEIISDFAVGIVTSLDEVNTLPENYEPALAQDGKLALRELIEDELILNLPIIPKHEPEDCNVKLPLKDPEWEKGKGDNPFQVLESLKHKQIK